MISGRRSPRRSTTDAAGMPLGGYQSPSGRTAGLPVSGSLLKPLCLRADRPSAALRSVEHHEGVGLSLVGLLALDVRQSDHLVAPVAVEVGDRRRRRRPLQPGGLADIRPRAGVPVVVVCLDPGAQPADELAPPEAAPGEVALPVRVPGRRKHRRTVVVEQVDLVVVEGDDDLELPVVVEVADADVLAVGAVPVVAGAVEGGVVARAGQRVEPRPSRRGRARRPVQRAGPVEDEDLRSARRRVRRCRHHLDSAVSVEVGRGETARFGALAAAAGRGRPARLEPQLAAAQVVGRDGPLVTADHDLRHAVGVQVGNHARGIDASVRRRPPAQATTLGVEDEGRVERRDDLEAAIPVEVDEPGGRKPAGLAGRDVPHEPRGRDRSAGALHRSQ